MAHETNLTRRIDIKEQRRTVLILTNGERTERDYFSAIRIRGLARAENILIVKSQRGSPFDIVRSAAAMRDSSEYDNAWAVCDVDEYDVQAAINLSSTADVNLALSQPCFEVWLILHKTASCPRFNNAKQASATLRKYVTRWDKRSLKFADFAGGIDLAVVRAKQLGEPPTVNPSTAIWRLIVDLGVTSEGKSEAV
jgi:hypothetical protein